MFFDFCEGFTKGFTYIAVVVILLIWASPYIVKYYENPSTTIETHNNGVSDKNK